MFKIKITTNEEVGFYCGIFDVENEKLCGYENDINNNKVKTYKTLNGAQKAITKLTELYSNVENYKFEIVQIDE